MKNTVLAVTLALVAGAGAAHAQTSQLYTWDAAHEWFHIDSGANMDVYINAVTRNADGTATLWMRTELKSPRRINGADASQVKTQYAVNCDSRSIRATAEVQYDATGNVTWSTNTGGAWGPVVPDSEGDAVYRLVCLHPGSK